MKGLFVLLSVIAAVSARSAGVLSSSRALALQGENPWLVHLRLAVSTSGFLETCAGSLIAPSWVLSTASCLRDMRFAWIRYGAVNVINPELVTESSAGRFHPDAGVDVALISVNRYVQSTANIAAVALATTTSVPATANFCAYGENEGAPGEVLTCFGLSLEADDDVITAQSEDGQATRFDLGAPLVVDGVQIGVLTAPANGDSAAIFVSPASYIDWINEITGENFSS